MTSEEAFEYYQENFRRNMKIYRKAYVGTQSQLAEKAGLNKGLISVYETGLKPIGFRSMIKISAALGQPLEDMLKCTFS